MSLKEKVELWQAGVENAVAGKFEDAVDNFTEIPEPSARIYFNIASAFLRTGNLEDAERVREEKISSGKTSITYLAMTSLVGLRWG